MQILIDQLKVWGFPETQAEKIASIFKKRIFLEKGAYFHQERKVCRQLGFITDGMCRFFYNTPHEEVTRWVALENEFVTSLGSFITQEGSPENIQAIKPTEILVASKGDWETLYRENEFLRTFWVKTIEAHYIGMETRVFNLIALSAEERYEWMLQHQPQFNANVPDKYVASMLGIKPRHLSRIRASKK
jgi:CRP-like cAMP-binding protein